MKIITLHRSILITALLASVLQVACSDDNDDGIPPTTEEKIVVNANLPTTTTPINTPDTVNSSTISTPIVHPTNYGSRRYCEVVAITGNLLNGFTASVYASHGLNDCPPDQWQALNNAAIKKQLSALSIKLNGPRYMLVDEIVASDEAPASVYFGELEMKKRATVPISPLNVLQGATTAYTENKVKRNTLFTFKKGSMAYFLTSPDAQYIMQSFAQIIDPNLTEKDLLTLANRLKLPTGWHYSRQILTQDILVDSRKTQGITRVLQDELENSYSRLDTKTIETGVD